MNFYDILQVKQSATKEEIKQSYYKLAKIYHPDKNTNSINNNFHEKFISIKNAYDVLSNDIKRKEYDMMSSEDKLQLYDILKDYFIKKDHQHSEMYNILLTKFNINEKELREDVNNFNFKNIYNNFFHKIFNKNYIEDIPIYNRSVYFANIDLNIYGFITTTIKDKYMNKFKKITVNRSSTKTTTTYIIPLNEDEIIIKNAGENNSTKNGDVILRIICYEDPIFKCIDDVNLYIIKYVSLSQYLYGGNIYITHLDGTQIQLTFPSCISTTPIFCIENKGLPVEIDKYNVISRGNLYIHLKINGINDNSSIEYTDTMKDIITQLFPPI